MQKTNTFVIAQGRWDGTLISNAENFTLLAEFVTYEGRCCPFLSFSLSANFGEELGVLSTTGPQDAQQFIQAELTGLL